MSKRNKTIKISDMVIALYYQREHPEERACDGYECKTEKSTCIDKEQVALVSWLVGDQVRLKNIGQKITFQCKSLKEDAYCQKAKNYGYDRRMISYKATYDNKLKKLIKNISSGSVQSVLQQLPIILSINISEKIDERDSICYLCLFGERRTEFIKLLLKASLIQSILLYLAGERIDDLVKGLEYVFSRILELYRDQEKLKDFKARVVGCVEEYDNRFMKEADSIRICRLPLRGYIKTPERKESRKVKSSALNYIAEMDDNEIEEIIHRYRLLVQVLKIMNYNVPLEYGDKLFTGKAKRSRIPHNIYDRLDEVLESISNKNANNKDMILKELADLLLEDGEESSDKLKKFYSRFINLE